MMESWYMARKLALILIQNVKMLQCYNGGQHNYISVILQLIFRRSIKNKQILKKKRTSILGDLCVQRRITEKDEPICFSLYRTGSIMLIENKYKFWSVIWSGENKYPFRLTLALMVKHRWTCAHTMPSEDMKLRRNLHTSVLRWQFQSWKQLRLSRKNKPQKWTN